MIRCGYLLIIEFQSDRCDVMGDGPAFCPTHLFTSRFSSIEFDLGRSILALMHPKDVEITDKLPKFRMLRIASRNFCASRHPSLSLSLYPIHLMTVQEFCFCNYGHIDIL
ncbi:hypothetical protein Mapa_004020 [Marchantia paleacea]|nr:hypothetical protein Mapa_004020 [Marchantia paleacea]